MAKITDKEKSASAENNINTLKTTIDPALESDLELIFEATKKGLEESAKITENGASSIEDLIEVFRYESMYTIFSSLKSILHPEKDLVDIPDAETQLKLVEFAQTLVVSLAYLNETIPYIIEEYKKPEYVDVTIGHLLKTIRHPDMPEPTFFTLYSNAYKAFVAENIKPKHEKPKSTTINRADVAEYPLDKLNFKIWNLLESETKSDELIPFDVSNKADKKKSNRNAIYVLYGINFDNLPDSIEISKQLTAFDKRVYIASAAVWNANKENPIISLSQIYYAMGNTGRPGASDLEKINNSITKMNAAKIYVTNEKQSGAYKYDQFRYDGSLLPFERVTHTINGKLTESAIHLFREPPMISFAKNQKQVTSIPLKLLQSPISKTEDSLKIEDYLIGRIRHAKGGSLSNRILYKTICDNCGIASSKQRQRMIDKVKKFLDYYVQCGEIKRYDTADDGITVHFSNR